MYNTTKAGLLSQLEKRELHYSTTNASILAKRGVRFEYLPPPATKKQGGKTCISSLPYSATSDKRVTFELITTVLYQDFHKREFPLLCLAHLVVGHGFSIQNRSSILPNFPLKNV